MGGGSSLMYAAEALQAFDEFQNTQLSGLHLACDCIACFNRPA